MVSLQGQDITGADQRNLDMSNFMIDKLEVGAGVSVKADTDT